MLLGRSRTDIGTSFTQNTRGAISSSQQVKICLIHLIYSFINHVGNEYQEPWKREKMKLKPDRDSEAS